MTKASDAQEKYKSPRRRAADEMAREYLKANPGASEQEVRWYLRQFKINYGLAAKVAWHEARREWPK